MNEVNFVNSGWITFKKDNRIYEYYGRELDGNNEIRRFIYKYDCLEIPIKDILDEKRDYYAPEFNEVYRLRVLRIVDWEE